MPAMRARPQVRRRVVHNACSYLHAQLEHRPHLVTAFALRGRGVADRDRDLELPESGLSLLLSSSLLLHRTRLAGMAISAPGIVKGSGETFTPIW